MKAIFIGLMLMFIINVSKANETCKTADAESLSITWSKFQDASLNGKPSEIATFYEFPIRLYGPYSDSKPLLISKKNFLNKYNEIFRRVGDLKEAILFSDLKKDPKSVWKTNTAIFDSNGCYRLLGKPIMKLNSYTFVWTNLARWTIVSVDVDEDFELIERDGYPLGKK